MVKKTKGKHRLDKYYHLAKEQGYRSRAAFKLVQLNRQFYFLDKARTCLDLCAAPGGWMQVAVKTMPLNSLVVGIDLDPIRPIKGAKSIVGDITTAKARAAIKKESGGSPMEVVLHDGAPNVGGVWASEAYSQSALVLEALRLAVDVLVPGGAFVTKIFRSQDYNALLFAFKQLFGKVQATKPAASRNTSAEIFVVCQGYKAPAKIDPRLLDPRHLFKEVAEAPKVQGPDALLKQKIKQKRFRDGYEEGLSSTHRQSSAADFVLSENPVEMLGQFTRFALGEAGDRVFEREEGEEEEPSAAIAAFLRSHPATNAEVKALLEDLQVLGRSEFKQLLKWRLKVKKDFAAAAPKPAAGDEAGAGDSEDEKDKEIALLEEMQDVKDRLSKRERREKKHKLKLKKKGRVRSAQLAMAEGINEDEGNDSLFALRSIQGKSRAEDINEAVAPDEDAAASSGEEDEDDGPESDIDTDEEDRRYEASVEEYLEEAYQQYKARKGKQAEVQREKRARLGRTGDLPSDSEQEEVSEEEPLQSPEFEDDPEVGGGLLVDLGLEKKAPKTAAAVAAQWFSQDLFADADEEDTALKHPTAVAGTAAALTTSQRPAEDLLVPKAPKAGARKEVGSRPAAEDGGEFEEVPLSGSESEGSSDSEPDESTAAELRALAKAMLSGRRKSDIVEGAYNRYAFHEQNLPPWFADDQRRYMRPPEVLSREEIEAEKVRNRAVDTRPIKKVAEAKARKKKRLQARLEQAKKKAGAIMEQGDLSERAKAQEVEKLYARAKAGGKGKKKASRSDKYKKKGPPLDRRLLSDKRPVHNKAKLRAAKNAKKKKGGAKNKGSKR